jgi:hypothetical protein
MCNHRTSVLAGAQSQDVDVLEGMHTPLKASYFSEAGQEHLIDYPPRGGVLPRVAALRLLQDGLVSSHGPERRGPERRVYIRPIPHGTAAAVGYAPYDNRSDCGEVRRLWTPVPETTRPTPTLSCPGSCRQSPPYDRWAFNTAVTARLATPARNSSPTLYTPY